jgi:hypothetical protein
MKIPPIEAFPCVAGGLVISCGMSSRIQRLDPVSRFPSGKMFLGGDRYRYRGVACMTGYSRVSTLSRRRFLESTKLCRNIARSDSGLGLRAKTQEINIAS